ncbi:hypothetical protein IAE35_05550 [Pseudomonas sp. S75]|uniref:DUF6966 domain-containing protein n=1 Tax=unclassified Pseudomonas TaxID=196821 RepID=UPI001903924F|nr:MULTISPECIES: hypothetical protein [unclassified Pseudomonas]MBJ9975229.1 hypothetical protein [Pseudomonas sp. S30]MBK0152797.1 hypothetical protein [Pseudomonas sp. S75]
MNSSTQPLIDVLERLALLLESDGDQHWSQWMRRARSRLLEGDLSGARYLLSAYGGMGSFNDLILGQHYDSQGFSWKPGHIALNDELDALRGEAYCLAQQLRRGADGDT